MVRREFTWKEDEEYGGYGWIMDGMPHFNAGGGLAVAHDCLEHFDKGDQLTDEWQAFGAMLFGRAMSGWFYNGYSMLSTAQHMGSDIQRFLQENQWQSPIITTRPLNDDCAEAELQAILRETRRLFYTENDRCDLPRKSVLDACIKSVESWMRVGFRRAEKRWHGRYAEMAHLFTQIQDEVDCVSKSKHREEGEELIVSFSPTTFEYTVQVRTLEDLYPDDGY